ncbi:hypothetical protein [Leeia sp.]|uniref:hypothetical protein n=1 Tax=Leeia sp. TaxID=2884678 RepID=UPI0035B34615
MSLEMQVFVPTVDDLLIQKWVERLNSLEMTCEIHPEFSFATHTGFLPFKVVLKKPKHEKMLGNEYLTGFEFYLSDFDLKKEVDAITPRLSILDRLKGKKAEPVYFASREIDARLISCKKVISCVWGSADTLELRMATLSAAILAELTDGVFAYPADNCWYTERGEVERVLKEAETYEASIKPSQLRLHKFEKWQ